MGSSVQKGASQGTANSKRERQLGGLGEKTGANGRAEEREIGVYWYLFSNHCTRECIHKKSDKQTKVKFSFDLQIISSSLISAPSFWRSHVLHDMRLRLTTLPSTISSRAGLGVQCYALSSSARPLAPVLSPRPGAGWCCSLLASPGPLNTPYKIMDNLCTNSPITTLLDCSLLSVDIRHRPAPRVTLLSRRVRDNLVKCASALATPDTHCPHAGMTWVLVQ